MADFSGLDDLRRYELDTIRWNGKANTVGGRVEFRINGCQRRNADQVALQIYQRSTAVAWINRCIGLNGIRYGGSVLLIHIAAEGTDNAVCDCLGNSQGIADSQHVLPHLQLRRVT